jgi:hypothetical protein
MVWLEPFLLDPTVMKGVSSFNSSFAGAASAGWRIEYNVVDAVAIFFAGGLDDFRAGALCPLLDLPVLVFAEEVEGFFDAVAVGAVLESCVTWAVSNEISSRSAFTSAVRFLHCSRRKAFSRSSSMFAARKGGEVIMAFVVVVVSP